MFHLPPSTTARTLALLTLAAAVPGRALAGGYDTPMLYSARHMGMGGAAIGYVEDPSALFHNPAGLGHTTGFAATGDFSLLLAHIRSSPAPLVRDLESELTVAPLFLLGGAYRVHRLVTIGLGVFPNASAGAGYKYEVFGAPVENSTRLVFIEGTPAIALNLPYRLRLGAGYRITYVNLQRYQGDRSAPTPLLDFDMSGVDWTGFRVGAQWTALDWLQVGAVYRHKTTTTVRNDRGIALSQEFTDIETKFTLPSKMGVGARADLGAFGVAVDAEYLLNSQNTFAPLEGLPPATPGGDPPMRVAVPNVFNWKDQVTLRAGVEYSSQLGGLFNDDDAASFRLGYIFDGETTNERYPSAFGTPPGPTHTVTAGLGVRWKAWQAQRWQVNLAYAHRRGAAPVREDVVAPREECGFCSYPGDYQYRITVNAVYIDVGFAFH